MPTIEQQATAITTFTLEDFLAHPAEQNEWIDGQLKETTGMTIRHSELQALLTIILGEYISKSQIKGKLYTELPCKTTKQGRRPDIAYLDAYLVEKYSTYPSLPQSPPFVVEISSPLDSAEDLFAKADEYLSSGCLEVWLVFPESRKIITMTNDRTSIFDKNTVVATQKSLLGFTIELTKLFA